MVILEGGDLAERITNDVFLSVRNRVSAAPPNPNRLSLSLSPPTGAFTGRFTNPGTGSINPLKGVLMQKQDFAGGFFLGTNQSGSVYFGLP